MRMRLIVITCCGCPRFAIITALSFSLALLAGCNRKESEKAPVPAATDRAARETEPEPVLSPGDAAGLKGGPGDTKPSTPADLAWEQLEEAMQPPPEPPEWQLQEPTKEQVAAFEKTNSMLAGSVADKAKDFYTR